ncbi:hypothetical protein PFISCL1PPCAC_7437 [Pristionchus fissidentatus]|uniref:Uncharacterized protein n=1 Tax=Pristionchus fissidentatus TaxID=1538716 RepID=A0AAV5VE11_9BILA|nr:hypothetical protein PFISCL1PPCAC_7437 [Pristionchus fissidentatus]
MSTRSMRQKVCGSVTSSACRRFLNATVSRARRSRSLSTRFFFRSSESPRGVDAMDDIFYEGVS